MAFPLSHLVHFFGHYSLIEMKMDLIHIIELGDPFLLQKEVVPFHR
jgi:hypothetical protein